MPENYQQAAAAWAKRCVEHGEEIERLRKALEFYADSSKWRSTLSDPIKSMGTHRYSPAERDCGQIAREALETKPTVSQSRKGRKL